MALLLAQCGGPFLPASGVWPLAPSRHVLVSRTLPTSTHVQPCVILLAGSTSLLEAIMEGGSEASPQEPLSIAPPATGTALQTHSISDLILSLCVKLHGQVHLSTLPCCLVLQPSVDHAVDVASALCQLLRFQSSCATNPVSGLYNALCKHSTSQPLVTAASCGTCK